MSDYIRREDVLEKCGWYNLITGKSIHAAQAYEIASVQSVDVVPVVRCRDCVHRGKYSCPCHIFGTPPSDESFLEKCDNDFCSYGKKKED